jgi:DNA polymerase-1
MNKTNLMIIDGHAFAFRAYYAFASIPLKHPTTQKPSGAIFGFLRMLFKLLNDYDVSHIVITFDPGTRLKRNDIFEAYKSHRKPMPEDLKDQIRDLESILKDMEFPVLKIDGIEADDLIATLSENHKKEFQNIFIFSSDKDLYQILDKNVFMLRGKKGVSEFIKIDEEWVKSEIGITKDQVTNYMGIVGDSVDFIPGVKGIGEKGAEKLISEFGTIENIYKNLDKIKNPGMVTKLKASEKDAYMSRELATLDCNVPIGITKDHIKVPNYVNEKTMTILKENGFNAIYKDIAKLMDSPIQVSQPKDTKKEEIKLDESKAPYVWIQDTNTLKDILKKYKKNAWFSLDTETTSTSPHLAEILGISFSFEEKTGYYISIKHSKSLFQDKSLSIEEVREILGPILSNPQIPKIGQNIKYDAIVLKNYGFHIHPIHFDSMLASYVLNPSGRKHNLDDLAATFLKYKTIHYEEMTGSGKNKKNLWEIDPSLVSVYASEDADIALRLSLILHDQLKSEKKLWKVFSELDLPLIEVLVEMEAEGIKLDIDYFKNLENTFSKKISELESSIYQLVGREFNPSSTKELQKVLFEELKLSKKKETQTGYSTDHSVLESLQGEHPIVDLLLDHRKFSKLRNTYTHNLTDLVSPRTGKVHTSFQQTIAATGRLSSTDPNLQNIPIKDEEGRWIRKGFVSSKPNSELLSLDYSQIELRIMAHYSNDPAMIDAYSNDLDIHRRTASALFEVSESMVTKEMRNSAKVVNFSVIYGVSAFGLAQNLKISNKEAKSFIDRYFSQYKGVKKYMEDMEKFCIENQYVETLMGRRRYISEISSPNRSIREQAKRIAINTPIQGTSADMIKLAMIQIHKLIHQKTYKSRMLLQVHDELVFEVDKKEKESFYHEAKTIMENALPLNVPIKVEGKFGQNWNDAH